MVDSVLLKFLYSGFEGVDVLVDDIDKVMLIDLVIEYLDKACTLNIEHPKYPCFTYLYKIKHIKLESDKDLMLMFSNLSDKKEIWVWVDALSEPTDLHNSVYTLMDANDSNSNLEEPAQTHPPTIPPQVPLIPTAQGRKKLTPWRSSRLQQLEVIIEQPPSPARDDLPSPPRENHVVELASFNYNGTFNNIDLDETQANRVIAKATAPKGRGRATVPTGRGRGRLRGSGTGRGRGRQIVVHSEAALNLELTNETIQPPVTEGNRKMDRGQSSMRVSNPSALLKQCSQPRKIPKTTAIRKGLPVSYQIQPHTDVVHRRRNLAVSLSEDASEGDLSASGDEGYDPSESESDEKSVSSVSLVDEEQMDVDGDYNFMVQDNFDAYEDCYWEEVEDDVDDYFAKLYNNGEVYNEQEFGKIELKEWQIFTDKHHLRDVLRDYCVQCGFSVIIERANNKVYTAICSALNCGWRMHAAILPDGITWAIKSIQCPEHTCLGLESENPMVNTKWATKVLLEDIGANNDIPAKAMNVLLFQRFGVQMKPSTLYKVRKTALEEIHGGHDVSYSYLPSYCEVIKAENPGSVADCAWNPQDHPQRPLGFLSIFISFKGCMEGLMAGCRSLIGVDGAHLKGNYGGVLLAAVALDANNEIFPFAWAIVAAEDEYAWKFFIHHLKRLLEESRRGDEWCIMSDRQKGIDKAIEDLWPSVDRRYCIKHLSKNFKKKFPGPLMLSYFWKVCGAYSKFTFKKAMEQLVKANFLAKVWLSEVGEMKTWTKHLFNPAVKCDLNKNNFVESFNATLGIDRCRPVLTLLEGVRRVTMVRIATRRQVCEGWERGDICPNIIKRLHVLSNESRTCIAYLSGEGEYEILDGKSTLPVSLNNMTCKCGQWQISGLPCKHAMRAIHHAKLDPHTFASQWYSVDMYKKTYEAGISSIPDREQWPETSFPPINPPAFRRGVGRPSRDRRREEDEQRKCKRSKTVKCSICKEFGHNAATCRGGLTAKQKGKKKAPAKPKKTYEQPSLPLSQGGPSRNPAGSQGAAVKTKRKGPTTRLSASQPSTSEVKPQNKKKKQGTATQPQ